MTAPTPRYWFEDFPVGRKFALGPFEVTRESVLDFARQWDPQPFHLDDAAGAASLFGGLAASGWHTCAMVHRMSCEAYMLETACLGSPGVEHLKWHKPVFPGDVLKGGTLITEARPMKSRPGLGLIRLETEIFDRPGERVYSMLGTIIVRMRPASP